MGLALPRAKVLSVVAVAASAALVPSVDGRRGGAAFEATKASRRLPSAPAFRRPTSSSSAAAAAAAFVAVGRRRSSDGRSSPSTSAPSFRRARRRGTLLSPNAYSTFSSPPRRSFGTADAVADDDSDGAGDASSSETAEEDVVDPWTLRTMTFPNLGSSSSSSLLSPRDLAEFLMEIGASSTSLTDHDRGTPLERPIFDEPPPPDDDGGEWAVICGDDAVGTNVWKTCDVSGTFPATFDLNGVAEMVKETFDLEAVPTFVTEDVPERDWVTHVQENWKPIIVEKFVLRFPWHTADDVEEALASAADGGGETADGGGGEREGENETIELELQGGIAFGTGEHPTTQHCLRWISSVFTEASANSEPVKTFLDYGAGSGVLGLAACALSPEDVTSVGIEIDADAVRIANANAEANGSKMKTYLPGLRGGEDPESASVVLRGGARTASASSSSSSGDDDAVAAVPVLPEELDRPIYDACAANILARPLVTLAPTIAGLVRSPGGKLGLSGILSNQAETVVKAYRDYFDDVTVEAEDGGWVLITGTRK